MTHVNLEMRDTNDYNVYLTVCRYEGVVSCRETDEGCGNERYLVPVASGSVVVVKATVAKHRTSQSLVKFRNSS